MNRCLSLVCSSVMLFAACEKDYGPGTDGFAVWSDDGSEILVVVHRYELVRTSELFGDNPPSPVDLTSELWRFDPSTLVGERIQAPADENILDVFDMKSRGYTVLEVLDRHDHIFWDRVDRDGVRIRRASPLLSPKRSIPIPSPSMDVVAWMDSECAEVAPELTRCTHHVEFVDSTTLADLGTSGGLTLETGAYDLREIWSPSGDFLMRQKWDYDSDVSHTYAFRLGEEPVEVPTPVCDPFGPTTSSSSVTADGRGVSVRTATGTPVITIVPDVGPGYPTRCFP